MGIYSTAELVFGIPISARHILTDQATGWWDEEEGWHEFPEDSRLEIYPFGHYENDEPQAILGLSRVAVISGDCWKPTKVDPAELVCPLYDTNDKLTRKADEDLQEAFPNCGLDMRRSAWYLVASVG